METYVLVEIKSSRGKYYENLIHRTMDTANQHGMNSEPLSGSRNRDPKPETVVARGMGWGERKPFLCRNLALLSCSESSSSHLMHLPQPSHHHPCCRR